MLYIGLGLLPYISLIELIPYLSNYFYDCSFVNVFALGSPQCFVSYDYIDHMITMTTAPVMVAALLGLACLIHTRTIEVGDRHKISRKYMSCFLFLTYLVLPSISIRSFGGTLPNALLTIDSTTITASSF